jgi:hypothetical protein
MEKAKYLVTYLCADCGVDFARTELSVPICFYCRSNGAHKIIKREVLTAEVMVNRMKFVSERAIQGLVSAFGSAPEEEN